MAQQLGYLYSSNRTAEKPVRTVIHTTFSPAASPRLWQRMENFNWHKWSRCHWWEQGLETLKSQLDPSNSISRVQPVVSDKAQDKTGVDTKCLLSRLTGPQVPVDLQAGKHKLVYLSADAEDELLSLSEDEIYIIGGIVDRNRHKAGLIVAFLSWTHLIIAIEFMSGESRTTRYSYGQAAHRHLPRNASHSKSVDCQSGNLLRSLQKSSKLIPLSGFRYPCQIHSSRRLGDCV